MSNRRSTARTQILAALVAAALGAACNLFAQDVVVPQSLSVTNWRDTVSIEYSSEVVYVQGATLRLNLALASVASSTNGFTAQGLDEVAVAVTVGNTTTSTVYSATVLDVTNGTARADVLLPAMSKAYWQVRITDVNTNVYYYQQQIIKAEPAL